jgi:glycosyltransferase involved in cell wall biosynthesis
MVPAYDCAAYLSDALRSVLAQDPGPQEMQIEVVDDGSAEDLESVVRQVGRGRVAYHRQPRNVGHIANFATCLERSRGQFIHLLHGDDLVRPGFYRALEAGFESSEAVGACFCNWEIIDPAGTVTAVANAEQPNAGPLADALARLAAEQRIVTPAIAVRRSVWETLGGFDSRLMCAEDWEMWVRIAAHYPIWYEPRCLAAYRRHDRSNSGRHFADASELGYTLLAMKIFRPLLPSSRAGAILAAARRAYCRSALTTARELAGQDRSAMRAHLRMAVRLWPSWRTLHQAAGIGLGSLGR